jgi:hypothetical protein
MTCPNDIHQTGTCHLCAALPSGCFLRDITPSIESDHAPETDHCDELGIPFADLPMCQ